MLGTTKASGPRLGRLRWLRRLEACAWLTILAASALRGEQAHAADPEPTSQTLSRCPDGDAVWSTTVKLVPSAATELLAAKPHVEMVDLGGRYRVHVITEHGELERVYSDPARDCDKRVRFAAEFIVVALLPPQLAIQTGDDAGARPPVEPTESTGRDSSAPAPGAPAPPPSPRAAERPAVLEAGHASASLVRLQLSGIAAASPPVLGAPGVLAWGGDLRVRIGRRTLGAMLGIAYLPTVDFNAGSFRGAITRVPAIAGAGLRILDGSLRLNGSLAATVAFERYAGVSPHVPLDVARLAPGLEIGVTASPRALAGVAPFLGATCAWLPLTPELVATPQGKLGVTPSLWFGAAVGLSLDL